MKINRTLLHSLAEFVLNNIVWFLLVSSVIVMGLIEPIFFTFDILSNIMVQATVLGILTAALSFIILLGEIDLSLVGIMGIAASTGTLAMNKGLPWVIAILIMLSIGAVIGLINGVLVTKLRAVSLIETLAVNIALVGAVIAITRGRSIVGFSEAYKVVGQGSISIGIYRFPVLPIVFIVIYILLDIIWKKTIFGRSLFAIGGNPQTALVSGINIDKIKIVAFIVAGVLAGFCGYLLSAYLGAVTTSFGRSYTMNSIAAAVIGGVSLSGGIGKINGILGGVLLLTVIQVGLQILGISSFYVEMSGGLMILIAVVIDSIRLKVLG